MGGPLAGTYYPEPHFSVTLLACFLRIVLVMFGFLTPTNWQAGAGIVADSVPADEQQECENKAAALARAIDLAESAFLEQ